MDIVSVASHLLAQRQRVLPGGATCEAHDIFSYCHRWLCTPSDIAMFDTRALAAPEDDLYEGFNSNPQPMPQPAAGVPPSAGGFRPLGTGMRGGGLASRAGAGMSRAGGPGEQENRPMTAVRAAGYTAHGRPGTGKGFDPMNGGAPGGG